MENFTPFSAPPDYCRLDQMDKPYKTLEEALSLVKRAVQGEREDELFYDYLISIAPTQEEKNIITTIRDDERKHNKYFREIYTYFTKQIIPSPTNMDFRKPDSYMDGIIKAKFGELAAAERYRDIRAGLPNNYYRDMVFEILTDELKHADKYDYILYLSLRKSMPSVTDSNSFSTRRFYRQTREFTLTELAQYNGSMGLPAYIAVNGIVYDVSLEKTWGGATHFGLQAGNDLTAQFQSCHGMAKILEKLPRVGVLRV